MLAEDVHLFRFAIFPIGSPYLFQSLLTKSHNWHALEMEAQPHHMTFRPHHIQGGPKKSL